MSHRAVMGVSSLSPTQKRWWCSPQPTHMMVGCVSQPLVPHLMHSAGSVAVIAKKSAAELRSSSPVLRVGVRMVEGRGRPRVSSAHTHA